MYILVSEKEITGKAVARTYHERMPDGRLILPLSELKMLGSVESCQIVATARELKELIKKQKEELPMTPLEPAESSDGTDGVESDAPELLETRTNKKRR